MKKKLSIFLILFIVSLFGNFKKEQLENKHIYHFFTHEIKEQKEEISNTFNILTSNDKTLVNIDKVGSLSNEKIFITFSFFPILKTKINKVKFYSLHSFNLIVSILKRYPTRVLRI